VTQENQIKKILETLSGEYPDYVFGYAHRDESIENIIKRYNL
jgi:hypothetical protein